jgi:hypothetical protein
LAEAFVDEVAGLWPQLEDLVPPELPPEVAVARLVSLARSLLIENRQLREVLAAQVPIAPVPGLVAALLQPRTADGPAEAA